jgi:hypothetical protein
MKKAVVTFFEDFGVGILLLLVYSAFALCLAMVASGCAVIYAPELRSVINGSQEYTPMEEDKAEDAKPWETMCIPTPAGTRCFRIQELEAPEAAGPGKES